MQRSIRVSWVRREVMASRVVTSWIEAGRDGGVVDCEGDEGGDCVEGEGCFFAACLVG